MRSRAAVAGARGLVCDRDDRGAVDAARKSVSDAQRETHQRASRMVGPFVHGRGMLRLALHHSRSSQTLAKENPAFEYRKLVGELGWKNRLAIAELCSHGLPAINFVFPPSPCLAARARRGIILVVGRALELVESQLAIADAEWCRHAPAVARMALPPTRGNARRAAAEWMLQRQREAHDRDRDPRAGLKSPSGRRGRVW